MTDRPHVLMVRLDSEGDVLLAGPAIRAVAAGAGRVTLLCGPRGRAAAELLPQVDEIIMHRAPWIDPEPPPVSKEETLALVDRLAALEPPVDQAVILTSFHQSPLPMALLLHLAGVPTVAAVSDDYPGSLLDVRHRVSQDIHEVERSLSLVATLGYHLPHNDDGRLAVRPTVAAWRPPSAWEDAAGRSSYVVVHPGASVSARAWSPDLNASLVDALVREGRHVVVTGGSSESELSAKVAGRARPEVVDLGGRTDLSELAAVIAGADAIVVGNTGPAHLAAAVGTPVVSIFAPTVPAERWRPWGVPHVLLGRQDIGCAGCRARVCPVAGHPCIDGLQVGEVLAALRQLAPPRLSAHQAHDRARPASHEAPARQRAANR